MIDFEDQMAGPSHAGARLKNEFLSVGRTGTTESISVYHCDLYLEKVIFRRLVVRGEKEVSWSLVANKC